MENIDNLLQIYEQLGSCTNPGEVETLKKCLKGSIQTKKREKEIDRDSCRNGGRKELGIRNVGKSRMLLVVEKSKQVDNLIEEVKELAEKNKFGDDLTLKVQEENQVKFPISNLVGEKFESYLNDISDLLTKHKASTVGVWGMGGVGKTTLIKHLHNMMLIHPHIYGFVYWITVSKDCSIQKLQIDIAKRIGEPISDKLDESQRAGILAEALKRRKKFVLILDDMWSDFDLNDVGLGIPKAIGYQLIITSRSKDVCSKIYCDNIIKVDPLSEKDALTLFSSSIGRDIPDNLTKISTDVLKECAGLPLGIITLAKSLIGCNDDSEWRNVLEELRNSSGKIDDMEEKVFNVLKLSYERLKGLELKECLLYCATYPEDSQIEIIELIWLFIDAGLLGKNVCMVKMFDKGLATLKKLERTALLSIEIDSSSEEREYVCLHDLIRDMALQIASSRFMIKAGIGLKGIPEEESWMDQLEVVSLMQNEIKDIYDSSPKCKRLTTLLLKRNYSLSMVCDGFFRYFNGLKLLELSDIEIRTLPESISLLKNLTALILRRCIFLENMPSLARLSSLERLDLSVTMLSQLPEGIENLIKLKYLNLSTTSIRRIDMGVISKLTALQYLAIDAIIDVKELNSLNNLEHLSVQFEDFVNFSTFIEQMKIKGRPNSYIFALGDGRLEPSLYMSNQLREKHIYLRKVPSLTLVDNDMLSSSNFVFDKMCDLSESKIPDVHKYNQLLNILFGDCNMGLGYSFSKSREKKVKLWRSSELERRVKLFCENEVQKLLQDILRLYINDSGDLKSLGDFVLDMVWNLQRQSKIRGPRPFFNLKSLELSRCPNMKKLFPLRLLWSFQNIEEIKVFSCEGLEELIEGEADETKLGVNQCPRIFFLSKLRFISLVGLPNLERLCSDEKVIHTPSLKWISICRCGKLKRMPFDVDNQPQPCIEMVYVEKEKEWVESLEWDPPHSKSMVAFSTNIRLNM